MRKLAYLLVFVLILSVPLHVLAATQEEQLDAVDDQIVIKDVEGLRLNLVQQTQDPGTKEVRFDLVIYSQITSDRVQISWSVTGSSELITDKSESMYLTPGNTYTASATVKPRTFGATKLIVTVEAYEIEGTYISTASKEFGTFTNGEIYPITDEYKAAQLTYYLQFVAIIIIVILFLGVTIIFLLKRFTKWYHKAG